MPRFRPGRTAFSLLLIAAVGVCAAQPLPQAAPAAASAGPKTFATIRSVAVVHEKDGLAVEILSSLPLAPEIRKLPSPPRLVIDLPDARLAMPRKQIAVQDQGIKAVRINQYQRTPPVTRVVVDLVAEIAYTWDAAGNRLMVRLKPAGDAAARKPAEPPTVSSFTSGVQPVVVPVSPGASGAVVLAGNRVAAGSSVTAGADTAILRLGRGGEVRVCPGTTVSVTASQNGRDLMLGMSTGALEVHYTLAASADSVLTPDFRILLPGPGEFHYAFSADARGNTCVRALPGNTASAVVSELMGDATYQVKPSEQVVFHAGRIDKMDSATPLQCGCPPPSPPVMRAAAPQTPVVPDVALPLTAPLAQPGEEVRPVPPPAPVAALPAGSRPPAQVNLSVASPESAPLPAAQPNEVHVQVDAPFVFRATDPPPAPTEQAARLPVTSVPRPARLEISVLPPAPPVVQATAKAHRGFLGKLKGFFAAIFR